MKKTLSFILALVMLLSMAVIPASAEEGWIELRVEAYDRSVAGFNLEDCWQLNYAQEHFGNPNKIKLVFVPTSRWDEGTLLTNYLAGGTAPDICMTYNGDLVNQYIEFDGLWQLDELLETYGQNLKAFLGEDLLKFGQQDVDGDGKKEQWFLPARRLSVANVGNFIRQDWLDALKMERPTTIERMDKIIFIDDGRLVAVGKHEALYESCEAYRKMVDLQRLEEEGGEHHD